MDIIKILSNPVRMRILQFFAGSSEGTTKQLAEYVSDVPVATLYRHINFMIDGGILLVKEERKVRGSVERVITLNPKQPFDDKDISGLAFQFLIELYSSFEKYSKRPDADPVRDKLALSTATFKLTDEEMDGFGRDVGELMMKYESVSQKSEGKLRRVSMIFSPLDETGN
ncbi:MAG: helix-turn-helix domain-containing protein [Eubacterium sp.]|nr:helix-turn-helix domain-containing protein [Eubacterium sp.]